MRVLTGIQSSGKPHLGNIIGAVLPALADGQQSGNPAFHFIADLHSLTTSREGALRRENTSSVAAAWLAFGCDPNKDVLYRQSRAPAVTELTWYLSCFTPDGLLARAHSFKDKSSNLSDVNAGLFIYPVLMAADILLYQASRIPVGKDQKQHIEITRDIAKVFNNHYGQTFVLPEPVIREEIMTIPGLDGRKMSKSYNNYIDIFQSDKGLKQVICRIVTDSTPVNEPKNPDQCSVFALYRAVASEQETVDMREQYLAGRIGYGAAKDQLYKMLLSKFGDQRERYSTLMSRPKIIEEALQAGETKARAVAQETIVAVRDHLGF